MGLYHLTDKNIREETERAFGIFQERVQKNSLPFDKAFQDTEAVFKFNIRGGHPEWGSEEEALFCSMDAWEKVKRELRNRCYAYYLEAEKTKKVNAIRAVQVENLVLPYILKAGLPYRLEYQMYRVKVSLLVDWSEVFTFYIKYRDLANRNVIEKLPQLLGTVPLLKDFGPQIRLIAKRDSNAGSGWIYPQDDDNT